LKSGGSSIYSPHNRKEKMLKNNLEKHIPMIRKQLWNICLSIKKSNPKLHKALVKDLIKLETERKK
jgi:hypothetical protein